jgi:sugar phosphate isomerase/epimerase
MTKPIALQLYSIRENLLQDFTGTITKVAEIGYAGVETAEAIFANTPPHTAARLFRDLGLTVVGAHAPLPLGDDTAVSLERMAQMNSTRLVSAWMPPETYQDVEGIKRIATQFNAANTVARTNGLSFFVHNHDFEFGMVNGRRAFDILNENLDPTIQFELDTYWVQVAGYNPAKIVAELGSRAPLLHIKDGPANRYGDMVAAGQGVIDIPAIVAAGGDHTAWLIVELDRCATDMMTAVAESYTYLTEEGLGHGTR